MSFARRQLYVTFADPASSRCLDAFTVALNQTCLRPAEGAVHFNKGPSAGLGPFCVACRNVTTLRLRVDQHAPPRLLAAADAPPPTVVLRRAVRSESAVFEREP